jgi:DNA (cytosine-5)-methyltransferase 3A
MNVLSLFDGCSGGQQALDRLGVKVDNYFASEIDKYAIQVTMANYPNTKQLGSVVNVDGYSLPKIDLLLGGSPCQSFSFAGKRKGMSTKCETEILTLEHYLELKAEGYEFEGQSYLFWEYMRLLNECKPTYFLLENVEMGEKWEKVLSKAIGVNGIHINSALVSAQNRKRIYWTNIGLEPSGLFGDLESIIEQPKDRGILLKDVLETEVDEKYFLSEKMINTVTGPLSRTDGKTYCLDTGNTNAVEINVFDGYNNRMRTDEKCGSITQHCSRDGMTNGFKVVVPNTNAVEIVAMRGRTENKGQDWHNSNHIQKLESRNDGKTNSITGVAKDNLVRQVKQISTNNKSNGGTQPYQQDRIYDIDGISPALNTDGRGHAVEVVLTSKDKRLKQTIDVNNLVYGEVKALDVYNQSIHNRYPTLKDPKHNDRALFDGSRIRRLTPIECERLQTVADNYTNHVSDSQRYKMLGNGWTIDVIAHILKYANF